MHKTLLILLTGLLAATVQAGPVDINAADSETLARELNGVGMSRAEAIVEYRQQFGPFRTADDLLNVAGIGEHILDANRTNILVGNAKR
ncbi:MAG: helix-hairpin-helix domain-containing protein [Gammaproteobacteria bacterium]|nr:helix-hairpin-helix domain-containing protein [Gammaproteobacteria bacterium]